MGKIAFIFPGQGSQAVGMSKEFYSAYPKELGSLKESVSRVCGEDFLNLMWNGTQEQLTLTTNTQPALYTASGAVSQLLNQRGYHADYVAGHSLGEYSALYAADAYSFETGLVLVQKRAKLMERAVPAGMGAMVAVMGLGVDQIESICQQTSGIVEIANYNNDSQIIISGERAAVAKAMENLKMAGAKRVIELGVSGPFHSSLMKPIASDFEEALSHAVMQNAKIPLVCNVSAKEETDAGVIKANLVQQLYQSVLWLQSVQYLLARGVDTFVECGSGSVLCGLIKRISREARLFSIENSQDLVMFEEAVAVRV
ncbi:MAG: ACP S-malonyltransferase [Candidatus Margulisiibacteriota bacterium]